MQTLRFKTSLKCNGCVTTIKPNMDTINGIKTWRVFLDVQEKTLEVDLDDPNTEEIANNVMDAVTKAGYEIENL
ncbi:MAG: heavy-metal-associated domain-containing protein [Bacteroidales bacterium]|jgi:copper chaperone|nr:heavy-metal-associated domain-containing protein [Bacteroidales bacterium]